MMSKAANLRAVARRQRAKRELASSLMRRMMAQHRALGNQLVPVGEASRECGYGLDWSSMERSYEFATGDDGTSRPMLWWY